MNLKSGKDILLISFKITVFFDTIPFSDIKKIAQFPALSRIIL